MNSINQNFITNPRPTAQSGFHSPSNRNKDFPLYAKHPYLDYFYEDKVVRQPQNKEGYKSELRGQMRDRFERLQHSKAKERELDEIIERQVERQRMNMRERYEFELMSAQKEREEKEEAERRALEEQNRPSEQNDENSANNEANDFGSVKNSQRQTLGNSRLSEFSYSVNIHPKAEQSGQQNNSQRLSKPFSVDRSKMTAKAIFNDSLLRSNVVTKDYLSAHKFSTRDILDRIGDIKAQNGVFSTRQQHGSLVSNSVFNDSTHKFADSTNRNTQVFSNFKPARAVNDGYEASQTFTPKKYEKSGQRVGNMFDTIDCSDIKDKIKQKRVARGLKVLKLHD